MNDLRPQNDKIINIHEFLIKFLNEYHEVKRGGVHDFIEMALYNMISSSISEINVYLKPGHTEVDPKEIVSIFLQSCQQVLDAIKRNIESTDKIKFQ